MNKIDDVTAGDVMLTALAVLTSDELTPDFLEGVTPRDLLRGLGGTVHLAVGRYALAGNLPMHEAAPILFNDLYREAASSEEDRDGLEVLKQAFHFMADLWREDPRVAAESANNVAGCIHALMMLGQVLLQAEAEVRGITMDEIASSYRAQIMTMMAKA